MSLSVGLGAAALERELVVDIVRRLLNKLEAVLVLEEAEDDWREALCNVFRPRGRRGPLAVVLILPVTLTDVGPLGGPWLFILQDCDAVPW